jgi:flagellar FliL protein
VVVNVVLGYDLDDKIAANELTNRLYELKDFMRAFFSSKSAAELRSENEAQLKLQIKEMLNSTLLQDAKVREILFQQLDVVEM